MFYIDDYWHECYIDAAPSHDGLLGQLCFWNLVVISVLRFLQLSSIEGVF